MIRQLVISALVSGALLLFSHESANAALIFNITEGSGTVDVSASGSVNLNAVVNFIGQTPAGSPYLWPSVGVLSVGDSIAADLYGLAMFSWTAFGTGTDIVLGSGSGDVFGLSGDAFSSATAIAVPVGYVSGNPIAGTSTFAGSFASLGLIPGTYVTTFSFEGNADSVTVNVIVPEPRSASLLMLGGLIYLVRRRKRAVAAG